MRRRRGLAARLMDVCSYDEAGAAALSISSFKRRQQPLGSHPLLLVGRQLEERRRLGARSHRLDAGQRADALEQGAGVAREDQARRALLAAGAGIGLLAAFGRFGLLPTSLPFTQAAVTVAVTVAAVMLAVNPVGCTSV